MGVFSRRHNGIYEIEDLENNEKNRSASKCRIHQLIAYRLVIKKDGSRIS
jgi:hypothetical protein